MEIELNVRSLFLFVFSDINKTTKYVYQSSSFPFLHEHFCNRFCNIRCEIRRAIAVASVVTCEIIDFLSHPSQTTTTFSLSLSLSSEISPLSFFAFVQYVLVISLFTHILKEKRAYMFNLKEKCFSFFLYLHFRFHRRFPPSKF